MNRTQRVAWLLLFSGTLGVTVFAYIGSIIALGRIPPRPLGQIVVGSIALAGFALLALTIFLLVRRQSPAEPEADERDRMIWRRAAAISFASSWLLLAVVVLVLGLTLGQTGSIPVYLLTVILLGVAVTTSLVHGMAILIQYGRGAKDGEK